MAMSLRVTCYEGPCRSLRDVSTRRLSCAASLSNKWSGKTAILQASIRSPVSHSQLPRGRNNSVLVPQ